jgi:ribosomal protein L22
MTEKTNKPDQIEDKDRKIVETKEEKIEEQEKKEAKKEKSPGKKIVKRDNAIVNGKGVPISTLDSIYICKFIKKKKIEDAIKDLEEVLKKKKAIPMKGEIPHRKGKIMSGRYPKKASEEFIKLLKSLQANANTNGLESPIIIEAVANIASRPYGRFGRVRRKRTHILIKAKEKNKK